MSAKTPLPRSISHWADPFIIVAALSGTYVFFRASALNNVQLAVVIVLVISAVMIVLELVRAPWSPFRLRTIYAISPRPLRELLSRTIINWLGAMGGFALIVVLWWLLAEYYRSYYTPFFDTLPILLVLGPVVMFIFIYASELLCGPTDRGGRELGLFLIRTMQRGIRSAAAEARSTFIRDDLLSWLLIGFFLPINFVELVWAFGRFRGQELSLLSGDFISAQYFLLTMIYATYIAAITPGYLFGSRLVRTETKAVDHSWFGWTVTLICYAPISVAVFGQWFDYRVAVEGEAWMRPWATSFESFTAVLVTIGWLIVFFELIHLWGEAQFGLRASNISNRGIITTGLFRITKHPIYVAKCAGWLLLWVPFIAGGSVVGSLRLTILWGFVCLIYALRALAEERVLATDGDYVAYALAMDERSIFAWVGRLFPIMTFRWRYEYWKRNGYLSEPIITQS